MSNDPIMTLFSINLIWLLIIQVGIGWLTGIVAESKGHNKSNWFCIGFLFGILGLLAAGFIGKKNG